MAEKISIIPTPKKAWLSEKTVSLQPYIDCVPQWNGLTEVVIASAQKICGLTLQQGPGGICICCDGSLPPEAYRLSIGERFVITAADYRGACHGASSLLQLLNGNGTLPCAEVEDWPDKDYRGLMINTVKYWHPFETLLHFTDMCFFLKIKYFHLHLTDVQNYTLPSRHFPKLTSTGNSYTEEQIVFLRAYAKARGVILIPELDMPGHMTFFNRVYPEVFSDELTEAAAQKDAKESSVVCAGNPKTFEAIRILIDEMMELFPEAPYIHLGGDEADYHRWDDCKHCQQYIREHQLSGSKELYAEFVGRVTDYVLHKGRTPIVWEGFSEEYAHHISKDVITVGWENYYMNADRLLANGYSVINCAWKPLYIVEYEDKIFDYRDVLHWHVHEWQHWWEKSPARDHPIAVEPTDQVLGAQVCVWSILYEEGVKRTAENLAAMSERVWTVDVICGEPEFERKLQPAMDKLFRLIADA